MEARMLKSSQKVPPVVTLYSRYTRALTFEYLCQGAYFATCVTEPTIYSPTSHPPSPRAAPPTAAQKLGALGRTRDV
jgi:hypothetical protein